MADGVPTPEAGRDTLEALLHERLGFKEEEAEDIMACYVKRVLVLPARAGSGFTLLATLGHGPEYWSRDACFGSKGPDGVKEWIYKRRHAWREPGAKKGPRLTVGHNLTARQRERQTILFPIQQQMWQQQVPVRMEYYPAVLLVVAGRDCHTANEATAAAAAYQKYKDRQQQAN
jgi:hypothetical protein